MKTFGFRDYSAFWSWLYCNKNLAPPESNAADRVKQHQFVSYF